MNGLMDWIIQPALGEREKIVAGTNLTAAPLGYRFAVVSSGFEPDALEPGGPLANRCNPQLAARSVGAGCYPLGGGLFGFNRAGERMRRVKPGIGLPLRKSVSGAEPHPRAGGWS